MYCISHNILSPLGDTSKANLQAVMCGKSALRVYDTCFPDTEPFCASMFAQHTGFTDLCIASAEAAIGSCGIDAADRRTVFVVSTTKGDNLDLLTPAQTIAAHFGNPNMPIVVSNACISGVSAQIAASRLLAEGDYDHAVVIGCDVLSKFIVSGFQSFKALSAAPCMPFDASRTGLNLGEAAATMVWTHTPPTGAGSWQYMAGSMHNDANHISGPSRTGEGSYRCLRDILDVVPSSAIDMVSVHGTATMYNDEMESIALHRAGLCDVPVAVFKGYYGHTLGAAGVLETILSMLLMEQQTVVGNPRYHTCGTTYPLNVQAENRRLEGSHGTFIKMLSGFGGCNAAACFRYCPL